MKNAVSKVNVVARLVKGGFNENDAWKMVCENYDFVVWQMLGKEVVTVTKVAKIVSTLGY